MDIAQSYNYSDNSNNSESPHVDRSDLLGVRTIRNPDDTSNCSDTESTSSNGESNSGSDLIVDTSAPLESMEIRKRSGSVTESASSSCQYHSDTELEEPIDETLMEDEVRECPLRFYKKCDWSGPNPHDLIAHCLQKHSENAFVTGSKKFILEKFTNLVSRRYYALFYEMDNVFRLTWEVDVTKRLMRIGLYFLYDVGLDYEYLYQIDFMCARKKIVKLKGPCCLLKKEEDLFVGQNYFELPFDLVKKHCDSAGTLVFNLTIGPDPQLEKD